MADRPGDLDRGDIDLITIYLLCLALVLFGFLLGVLAERHLIP